MARGCRASRTRADSVSVSGRVSGLAAGVAAVIAATAGVVMVRVGGSDVRPPPAPLPRRVFSQAALPPLAPGQYVPAAGSRAAAGAAGGVGSYSGASRLYIVSLGIAAPIVDAPTTGSALVGPGDVATVGRWTGGASLDSASGTVDLAGHVDYVGQGAGALYHLYQVQPGALVVTTDSASRRTPWRVTALQVVAKNALPASLFAPSGARVLQIITCGGALVREPGGYYSYADNVIATAVPV